MAEETTETKAVAVVGDAGLPAELGDYTGMEGITPDALIIPRMKVVQPTSKEGTEGNFSLNLTGEEFPEIKMVIIKAQRGRIMWDDVDREKPLCRSYDFEHPDPAIEDPPSPTCMRYEQKGQKLVPVSICEKCKWGPNGEKPECSEQYNLLAITEEGIPFWFASSGTSIAAVRCFISAIYMKKAKLFEYSITAHLEKVVNDKGKYYVLKFKDMKKLTKEEIADLAETIVNMKDESIDRTFRAEEEAAQEVDDMESDKVDDDTPF